MPNRNPKHRLFGEPFPQHLRRQVGLVARDEHSSRRKKEKEPVWKGHLFGPALFGFWFSIPHPVCQEFRFLNLSVSGRPWLVPRENF